MRHYKHTIIFYIFFILLLLPIPLSADQNAIRLTNGEWSPFMGQNLRHHGVLSHIVTEAFGLEGIDVEYGFFPWKRSYLIAESGIWDGSVGWSYNMERGASFYFSDPIIISSTVFFYLKDKPFDWNTYEDLEGKIVGASLGYWYGEAFTEAERKGIITVDRTTTDEQNMKKLLLKRLDLFVVNPYVGYNLLHKYLSPQEAEKITYHPKMIRETNFHLILSKKNSQNESRMVRFNKGLARMKERGTVELYLNRALQGEYER